MSFFRSALITLLITLSPYLFSLDFHDFDGYQNKLTAQEIELKLKTCLKNNPEIEKFYKLTPEKFIIGNLKNEQIDYTLFLIKDPLHSKEKQYKNLKNMKIAIDPGHFGGKFARLEERFVDLPKEKTKNNQHIRIQEGDLTFLTAFELKRLLEEEGATVFLTRDAIGKGAMAEDFFQWLENHSVLQKHHSSLARIFRTYYNREDLIARANKINAFAPDITIIIHYNAHLTEEEKEANQTLTQSNYNLAFIPGAFHANELNEPIDRYEFLRLIVTDAIECSLKLSEEIVTQFVAKLEIPLIRENERTSYTDNVCIFKKPGIYCRNLALTRLVHSPVCYGETLIQNNEVEIYKLSATDASIANTPCSKRIEQVAQAYFQGIKNYCESKDTCPVALQQKNTSNF